MESDGPMRDEAGIMSMPPFRPWSEKEEAMSLEGAPKSEGSGAVPLILKISEAGLAAVVLVGATGGGATTSACEGDEMKASKSNVSAIIDTRIAAYETGGSDRIN